MNEAEIGNISRAVAALRPDWNWRSLNTFLSTRLLGGAADQAGELAGRSYEEVALALAYVALRTGTQTPRLVLEPGPWWNLGSSTRPDAGREDPDQPCPLHPDQKAGRRCAPCAHERLERYRTEDQLRRSQRVTSDSPEVQELLHQVRERIRTHRSPDTAEHGDDEAGEAAVAAQGALSRADSISGDQESTESATGPTGAVERL